MNAKWFKGILVTLVFFSKVQVQANLSGENLKKPNIIYILVDDLGFGDVGFHGSNIPTPNIDALAEGGVKLESLYTAPLCTPSRASLMTGRFPFRYGLQSGVITPGQHYGLPLNEKTVATALKELGYKTYLVGKWHLGHAKKEYWPTRRGFDHYQGNLQSDLDYWDKERGGTLDWQKDEVFVYEEGYVTDLVSKKAKEIIEGQESGSPFFLYIAHPAVHFPYQAPEEAIANFTHVEDEFRRIYSAMVSKVDESVGIIVSALEEKNLRDNTLIVFSSDNGGVSEYIPILAKTNGDMKPAPAINAPLRGAKASMYEGGIRVVSFANWPGKIPAWTESNTPIHMVDWFPTFVTLAGAEESKSESGLPIDGKNIWNILIGEESDTPHQDIPMNVEMHRGAIRSGNKKLIKHALLPSRVELYDLEEDPCETTDLAEKNPDEVKKLEKKLNEYAGQSVLSLFFREYIPYIQKDTKISVLNKNKEQKSKE